MENEIELFVPGRLCVIGEHSDWAGLHRMMNAGIVPGQAIVTGIEQGIYATAKRSDRFIVRSDLEYYQDETLDCPIDACFLRNKANEGGFFSYVAGVASYVMECYSVGGLEITITKMDLPIKRGLSSSAAICVLVARAYNKLYQLHLNTVGEMNIAFIGEQRTPSRCGRLDQACAYGVKPVHMIFDGNDIRVNEINFKSTLYWVVADLNSSKDTIKILSDLNKCYPFPQNDMEVSVQEALGVDNEIFITRALECLKNGDNEGLGLVMQDFQNNFDKKVAPACPSQLKAPLLHMILNDERVKQLTYGAKGVGSQGDGTVQFLAKSELAQKDLIAYLESERGLSAFSLTLKPQQAVKKAIIPVAGYGTRLYPETKITKKDLFPILDKDGMFKPAIMVLLEQLEASGIEEICLVISEDEKCYYDKLFSPLSQEHRDKLSDSKRKYEDLLARLGKKVQYSFQKERNGFGHAVYQCSEFANGEPVLLLLGDMIYESETNETCMMQLINAYEATGKAMVSMHCVPVEDVVHYGIMHGQWEDEAQTLLKLDEFCEKPSVDYAEEYLTNFRNNERQYYAVFGQYILTKDVFEVLGDNIKNNVFSNGEIQLTDALARVMEKAGMNGFLIKGKSYDIGLPEKYIETITRFAGL